MFGVSVIALLVASPALAGNPWTSNLEPPPAMRSGALILDGVCPEDNAWPTPEQLAGRDVKITFPKNRDCFPNKNSGGKLISTLEGLPNNPVHNIWVVAPVIKNKWGQGSGSNDKGAALLRAQYFDGTFFIEGGFLDAENTCEDIVNTVFAFPGARVVIQNSYLTGNAQCRPGTHGDTFQNQGSGAMVELVMQNVVADQTFQGIFVPPRTSGPSKGHGITGMKLDHVLIRKIKPPLNNTRAGFGHTMFWKQPDMPLPVNGVTFSDVYLDMPPHTLASTPPPAGFKNGCAIYANGSGVKSGTWCYGSFPGGWPAPMEMIGHNYSREAFTGGVVPEEPATPPPTTPTDDGYPNSTLPHEGQPSRVVFFVDGDDRNVLAKLRTLDAVRWVKDLTQMLNGEQ